LAGLGEGVELTGDLRPAHVGEERFVGGLGRSQLHARMVLDAARLT
jgi:hypothetical protein